MLHILYEDKYIAVAVKPAGVLSERDENKVSMPLLLCSQLSLPEVYSVHRLDKNVGGVMVYAKSSESASILISQIAGRTVTKKYLAVVNGRPENSEGELHDLLFHDSSKNKTYVVGRMRKGVREASLHYKVAYGKDGRSLLIVRLFTGRTHQIRVQFASRGYPIVGDGRYGARDGGDEPMLFSAYLSFTHPKTGQRICFSALPDWDGWLSGGNTERIRSELAE